MQDGETPVWFKSLRMRLAAMMSLALLPVGLIAVMQTNSVSEKARENAELAMLGLTETAAVNERLLIQRAFGAAAVLASEVPEVIDDALGCSQMFSRFVASSELFSFAGYLPLSGNVTCSSADRSFDFSGAEIFQAAMAERTRRVEVNVDAPLSGTSVVIVSEPVFKGDQFFGFVSVSIPHSTIDTRASGVDVAALIDILTFNEAGTVLTSQLGMDGALGNLPSGGELAAMTSETSRAVSQRSVNGDDLIYAVVPVEYGQVYVLGIWDSQIGVAEQANSRVPASFFPVLMWIISVGVALLAVNRLVIRHIKALGIQMSQFATDRRFPEKSAQKDMSTELQNIQNNFAKMANSILRDEAVIEDAMRQKTVLLKEVHHRVKNNLQLISSILNMQIRAATHDDTKVVLRRMQDRVLSLATIHSDLYQTTDKGSVNVGNLVREIVDKTVEIGSQTGASVEVIADIDDVLLFPDQAVPMSLLASEAVTNAIKYAGVQADDTAHISVTFQCDDERNCVFELTNPIGAATNDVESTGMGSKLISAFATQLGATIDVEETKQDYSLIVRFKASEFEPEPGNF